MAHPYTKRSETRTKLGLIALQSDRTIEDDFRRLMPADISLLVSRVRSSTEVSSDTLAEMEGVLSDAAALFPRGHSFDVVGYGCTSASAVIGTIAVEQMVQTVCEAQKNFAKAQIVDRKALAKAQATGDIVAAETQMKNAIDTDVSELMAKWRPDDLSAPDPDFDSDWIRILTC